MRLLLLLLVGAQACTKDGDCESNKCLEGYFTNECSLLPGTVADGDNCGDNIECVSGTCLKGYVRNACEFRQGTRKHHESCTSDTECQSGHCLLGYTFNSCSALDKSLLPGADCWVDKECVTGKCLSLVARDQCAKPAGSIAGSGTCAESHECASGFCSTSYVFGNKCQNSDGEIALGGNCRASEECKASTDATQKVGCARARPWHREGTCEVLVIQPQQEAGGEQGLYRCSLDAECRSGKCVWSSTDFMAYIAEGFCSVTLSSVAPGAVCSIDEECSGGGKCMGGMVTNTCSQPAGALFPGAECHVDTECSTGKCKSDMMKSWNMLIEFTPTCALSGLLRNTKCDLDQECGTNFCYDGKCVATGTVEDAAECTLHKECASAHCYSHWTKVGQSVGKCDTSLTNQPVATACYRDSTCSSGRCLLPYLDYAGSCAPLDASVDIGGICGESKECKSNICLSGALALRWGGLCQAPPESLQVGDACFADGECKSTYCKGNFFGVAKGVCHFWTDVTACGIECGNMKEAMLWNSVASLPEGITGVNPAAVRTFILDWRKNVANWTSMGEVEMCTPWSDSWCGTVDLIPDSFELDLYQRIATMVYTLINEIVTHVKFHGFNQKFEIGSEGVFNLTEEEMSHKNKLGSNSTATIFNGSDVIFGWVDKLIKKEKWFEKDMGVIDVGMGVQIDILPDDLLLNVIRQGIAMGLGLTEITLSTGEIRLFGRWFNLMMEEDAIEARRLQDHSRRLQVVDEADLKNDAALNVAIAAIPCACGTKTHNEFIANFTFQKEKAGAGVTSLTPTLKAAAWGAWRANCGCDAADPFIKALPCECANVTEKSFTASYPFASPGGANISEAYLTWKLWCGCGDADERKIAEDQIKVLIATFGGVNDSSFVDHFVSKWMERHGGALQLGQYEIAGIKIDVFKNSWETEIYKKMVGAFTMLVHKALNVDFEIPFLFGEKLRLSCVETELDMTTVAYYQNGSIMDVDHLVNLSRSNSSRRLDVAKHDAQVVQRRLENEEKAVDGYGAVNKYVTQAAVDPESINVFIEEFFTSYPEVIDKGNIGGLMMCDPFGCLNATDSCVFVDIVDDRVLLHRMSSIVITFASSALLTSETRIFHQRFYAKLASASAKDMAFGTYLRSDVTRMQVEQVQYYIESRFDSVLDDKIPEMQAKLQTLKVGDTDIHLVPLLDLKEFAVKAMVVPLMFIEMLILDVRLELLGRTYKFIPTVDKINARRLADRALQAPPKVDWNFVDQFIEEYYTTYGKANVGLPPIEIDLPPLFKVRVELKQEWEKFLYKVFFGVALDLMNAQIEELNFNLPLPLVRQAISLVPNPAAAGAAGGGTLTVPPLTDIMHLGLCFHGSEWFKCALPKINPILKAALKKEDPKERLDNGVKKIETSIDAINANGKCQLILGELAGFSNLYIKDLVTTVDWRCGLSQYCKVCTNGNACGGTCILAQQTCAVPVGCAIDAKDAPTDVTIHGRTLRPDGTFMLYCRVCVQGAADKDTCTKGTPSGERGCAANPDEVVCKVCTGGRKKCGNSCIEADATCPSTVSSGCARDSAEVADIDLLETGGSAKGHVIIHSDTPDTEITLQIQLTCEADFCGKSVVEGDCCEGEEKHGLLPLCYKTCDSSTSGEYPNRLFPLTCGTATPCKENEDLWALVGEIGLCHKKCATLTADAANPGGTHTERVLPNTCKRAERCQAGEEEFLGLCYKTCSSLTGGTHPKRTLFNVCAREARCRDDQEEHCVLGICACYKKCSLLTGNSHTVRVLPTMCRKSSKCASNEEQHGLLCFKSCSVLTGGYRPARTAVCTCAIHSVCHSGYNHCGLHCSNQACWKFWAGNHHLIYDPSTQIPSYCTSGDGGAAKPIYHAWTKGSFATDGFSFINDPWLDGFGCNGFGISVDGGCANIPHDPWMKGAAITCSGFAVSGDGGCPAVSFRPQTAFSYGTAANGGLAHFPNIDPITLNIKVTVKGLRADTEFDAILNPNTVKIDALTISNLKLAWSDVRVNIAELGVFNVMLEALSSAAGSIVGTYFENTLNQEVQMLVNKELAEKVVDDINRKELNWDKIIGQPIQAELDKLGVAGGRRLGGTESKIVPGLNYKVLPGGRLEPKEYPNCFDPSASSCANPAAARQSAENFLDPVLVRQLATSTSVSAVEAVDLSKNNPYTLYQLDSGYYSLHPNTQASGPNAPLAVVVVDPHPTGMPHWNTTIWRTLEITFVVEGIAYSKLRLDVPMYVQLTKAVTKAFAEYAGVPVSQAIALPSGTSTDAVLFRGQIGIAKQEEATMAQKMKSQISALPGRVSQALMSYPITAVQNSPGEPITVKAQHFSSADETVMLSASETIGTPLEPTGPTSQPTGPTSGPTAAPSAPVKKVKIGFTIPNIDFAAMNENMKRATKQKIADGIAADTPGVSVFDVTVELSSGSLVVKATITPPAGSNAESIESAVKSSETFEAMVVKHLNTVPDLKTVTTAGTALTAASITGVAVATVETITTTQQASKPSDFVGKTTASPEAEAGLAGLVADTAFRGQSMFAAILLVVISIASA